MKMDNEGNPIPKTLIAALLTAMTYLKSTLHSQQIRALALVGEALVPPLGNMP